MLAVAVGKEIEKTVDAVSACGNINLVNKDLASLQVKTFLAIRKEPLLDPIPTKLQADYAMLHTIVERGLFTVAPTAATTSNATYIGSSPLEVANGATKGGSPQNSGPVGTETVGVRLTTMELE